jgi:hypothetical protein
MGNISSRLNYESEVYFGRGLWVVVFQAVNHNFTYSNRLVS